MTPLRPAIVDEMRWYFEQLRTSSRSDVARFNRCRAGFSTSYSQAIYKQWKQEGEAALVNISSDAIRQAVEADRGRIEVLELGHRYGHLSPLATIA
jgi:hypothetical protein